MRVASKVAAGSGVTVVLLLAVVAYDLSLVRQLASVHHDLSEVSFRVSTVAVEQSRLLNRLDEFTRKYFVTRDPGYAERLGELQVSFEGTLAELEALQLSAGETQELERLVVAWTRYSREFLAWRGAPDAEIESALEDVSARLRRVRSQVEALDRAGSLAVADQVARSSFTLERARKVSWTVAGLALLVSLVALWLTIRSIRRPLKRLVLGTQEVAHGDFGYRLPSSGNDEFSQVAASFNEMVERLGELDRMKREFLSHVSHELKTPIVAMQETVELLLERIPGPLNERQERFLTLNLESGRRLSTMIARLLDLARMEAGVVEYELEEHDVVELIDLSVAELEVRARELSVRLQLDVPHRPLMARCDRDRLIQVTENLIDNALKYSPDGSTVRVKVGSEAQGNNGHSTESEQVLVQVADQGPGVPPGEEEKIFERFHQISTTPRRPSAQGVGLGLAICREIVEAHHGAIWISATSNRGTTVSFTLPRIRLAVEGEVDD